MPPKVQPRRKPPARSTRSAAAEGDSVETQSQQDQPPSTQAGQEVSTESNAENSAASTTPAAEAAPSTTRRPVQRLKSALSSKGSGTPSTSSGPGGSDNRPTSLKFQPKSFIRRNKEERERLEKADAAQQAARHAAENKSAANARGGFQARGRGRGGARRFEAPSQATGALGGSAVQENQRRSGWGGGGGGGASAAGTGSGFRSAGNVKRELPKAGVKSEHGGPSVSWGGDIGSGTGPRISIEDFNPINLISDEESEDDQKPTSEVAKGKKRENSAKLRNWHMRPIRLERQEHMERTIGINTDASSTTSAVLRQKAKERQDAGGDLFVPEEDAAEIINTAKTKGRRKNKDVEFVRDERKWKGVYQDDDEDTKVVKVKEEPRDDDLMVLDEPMQEREPAPDPMAIDEDTLTAGPEVRDTQVPEGAQPGEGSLLDGPKKKRLKVPGFHNRPPLTSSEDEENGEGEEELDQDFVDIENLEAELDGASNSAVDNSSDILDEDDVKSLKGKSNPDRRDVVYLFQLPPIVPKLRDIAKKEPVIKSEDKKQPKATLTSDGAKPTVPTNPFNTHARDEPNIKHDPDQTHHAETIPHACTVGDPFPPGGYAGTFTIYETGRTLASWGGMSFEVQQERQEVGLAQEVMLTEYSSTMTKVEDESRWEEVVRLGSHGWCEGDIEGMFAGTPDLGSLMI